MHGENLLSQLSTPFLRCLMLDEPAPHTVSGLHQEQSSELVGRPRLACLAIVLRSMASRSLLRICNPLREISPFF